MHFNFAERKPMQPHVIERCRASFLAFKVKRLREVREAFFDPRTGRQERSVRKLMDTCLVENDRRLGIYDKRLKRPRFVPFMIRQIRRFIPK